MSQDEAWTVGRLLAWTTDYFKEKGLLSPRLDAELLLAKARGCSRIELYTDFGVEVDGAPRDAFRELVRRRAGGAPVAYLTGQREFYSLPFFVTPDVLIPRPETEHVVMAVLDVLKEQSWDERPAEVADVGVGSGAIAVAVAVHAKKCRVTAVDISPAALQVARRNVEQHGLEERIDLHESDLLASAPKERLYDIVASNPPYVSKQEYASLAAEVRDNEPRVALTTGGTGVDIYQRLVPQAAERLRGGGWMILEISPMIEKEVVALIDAEPRFGEVVVTRDMARQPRVVQARRVDAVG